MMLNAKPDFFNTLKYQATARSQKLVSWCTATQPHWGWPGVAPQEMTPWAAAVPPRPAAYPCCQGAPPAGRDPGRY